MCVFYFILFQEVADFHEFCARNYGLTGGWSSKDHETFLKIRSRSSDGGNFIDHIVQTMPRNVVVHEYFSFQRPVGIVVLQDTLYINKIVNS